MAKKILLFFVLLPLIVSAQQANSPAIAADGNKGTLVRTTVYEGETIPLVNLPPVICTAKRVFKNKRDAAKWTRLLYNVKKVYPYAILASAKLKEYDRILANIPNENERKKYMAEAEEHLKNEFGPELKNLTISQGKILLKLVDRETGKTTYKIVKEMRGSFSAFMWQSLAILFDSNLKTEYDAQGDDKLIEQAIQLIEDGQF